MTAKKKNTKKKPRKPRKAGRLGLARTSKPKPRKRTSRARRTRGDDARAYVRAALVLLAIYGAWQGVQSATNSDPNADLPTPVARHGLAGLSTATD